MLKPRISIRLCYENEFFFKNNCSWAFFKEEILGLSILKKGVRSWF